MLRKELFVRTGPGPLKLKPALERVIAAVDSDQAPYFFTTQEEFLWERLQTWRFWLRLFLCFAAAALILAVVGVFGVIAATVSERTHEMGVRMAIGAQKRDIFALVIKQGLKVTLIGLGLGTAMSLALSRLLVSLRLPLYEVSPTDPITYALAACYFPARRATRVDPVVALKYE